MKIRLIILFLGLQCILFSQKSIVYQYLDIGFGGFSVISKQNNIRNESGGLTFYVNNKFLINKNYLSVDLLLGGGAGSGYASIGGDYDFKRINLLFGREFRLLNFLYFSADLGLGYYYF